MGEALKGPPPITYVFLPTSYIKLIIIYARVTRWRAGNVTP